MTNEGTINRNSITEQAVTNCNCPNARTVFMLVSFEKLFHVIRPYSTMYYLQNIIERLLSLSQTLYLQINFARSFFCAENRCFFSRFIRLFSLSIETISGYSCICLTEWMDSKRIREHRIRFLSTRQRVAYALHAYEACQFFCTLYHEASPQLSWYHRDFPPPNNLSVQ